MTEDTKEAIRAALAENDGWLSSRAIHRLINIGAESTISKILRDMANDSEIERELRPFGGGTIAMYRGKQ